MMSYKAWRAVNNKLMNESALGTTTLGLRTPASLGITGSKLAEMGFPPPEGEEDELGDEFGGDDLEGGMEGEEEVAPEGMDDPDMLALLGGDEEGAEGEEEVAPEMGDEADALGDDAGMGGFGGEEEDEFAFDPAMLGGEGQVPDSGKTADLSNLFGGMGVGADDAAPDMGDGEEGGDISSLLGGAGDDDGANPFGGEEEPDGDEGIDDELDQDMSDDDGDEDMDDEDDVEGEKKFMGKGWCGKMMKKEAKEFPAFLKKGKDGDKKSDKKDDKKGKNPFAKKSDKKDDKKDAKKGGFELFKKKTDKKMSKEDEKCEENSFFSSLTKQGAGNIRKLKEDALITPKASARKEPGPGEVGYAPSGRVGELPSVSAYSEWKQKNFPKK